LDPAGWVRQSDGELLAAIDAARKAKDSEQLDELVAQLASRQAEDVAVRRLAKCSYDLNMAGYFAAALRVAQVALARDTEDQTWRAHAINQVLYAGLS
jgi:hypothetical protein